ncbi:sporulation protein YpjB [Mechercharimyces sp. CAU 1602]|uniref:sporulation protein YpjB n=1 Tax=Mechercharimyces sp. CAU 1602 TaxID=2973933 RepID=UPI002161EFF9|nr:sporulation protein YpjB [Mechercharimyces sp. CAU 1602]MCS1351005.1 sporulation protein YpjB [Mechercharimyces sp. CAU 1602]
MRVWRVWSIFFCILIILAITEPIDKTTAAPTSWTKQTAKIEAFVQDKKWKAARNEIRKLADSFAQADFTDYSISVEAVHVLSESIIRTDQALSQVKLNPRSVQWEANRLHLAFDALEHDHQPQWHQMYEIMEKDIQEIKAGIKANQSDVVESKIGQLRHHYEWIYPALVIDRSQTTVKKIDSLMIYLDKQVKEGNMENLMPAVEHFQGLLYPLYYGPESDVSAWVQEEESINTLVIIWLGGMIVLVLAYASWVMLREEKRRQERVPRGQV